MDEKPFILIGVMSFFTGVCWIVWVIATNIRRTKAMRATAEMHARLLDRFNSSPELLAYVESDAGKRFLSAAAQGDAPAPHARILNAVQAGIIMIALGSGILGIRLGRWSSDMHNALLTIGMPVLAVGIGFLLSSVAAYAAAKNLGLLPAPQTIEE